MRSGSFTLAVSSRSPPSLSIRPFSELPPRFRFWPGRRLTVIMDDGSLESGSGCGAQREADRQHQQWRDLVHLHRVEYAVCHLQLLDRIRQLHRNLEPIAQGPAEPWNSGAATSNEDPADTTGRAARGLKKGAGALDADRQLLGARLEKSFWDFSRCIPLEQLLSLFGRLTSLPLQIFPKAPGADRDVAGQHRDPVVQDVDVGRFVTDI